MGVRRLASSDVYDPVPQGRRAVRFVSVRVVARYVYSCRREAPKGRGPPKGGRIPVAGAEREACMYHMRSMGGKWVADRLASARRCFGWMGLGERLAKGSGVVLVEEGGRYIVGGWQRKEGSRRSWRFGWGDEVVVVGADMQEVGEMVGIVEDEWVAAKEELRFV